MNLTQIQIGWHHTLILMNWLKSKFGGIIHLVWWIWLKFKFGGIIHLVWLNVNWWWMYDVYVIVHNSYDTSSLLSMNLTQSKIMIILGRRRLQIFFVCSWFCFHLLLFVHVFGFVFIYSFLSTVLVTPQTKPMLVQTTPNMLQNCNQKTTFTQDFDCNILFLQIFQRKDLLCCESFSATRCSLLTLPAPTLNQMAEKTFHCSDEKLSRGKKREIPC